MLYDKRWEPKPQEQHLTKQQQILLDAAQYIRVHGWCQGYLKDGTGGVCVLGAITTVHKDPYLMGASIEKLEAYIHSWPAKWNDVPGRTKEQVIQALEEAARQ